ncbi:MAG: hypothetical protein JKY56_27095 [Kofleriaceae bacterium]|nr:hypothetical protein [Kofleriaceae bacterium]
MRMFAIAGGIVAIAAVLTLVLWPENSPKSTSETRETTSQTAASTSPSPATNVSRDLPTLKPRVETPTVVPGPELSQHPELQEVKGNHTVAATDSLIDAFEKDEEDAVRAAEHALAIHDSVKRLRTLLGSPTEVASVDCKSRHCKLQLSGEIQDLMPMLGALQDERGMMGIAESMAFHRENDEIHIYFRFPEESDGSPTPISIEQ